ncbi:MAG: alanine racemase [Candidatus Eisenbacteria bacterium]|nr:alanine racemase [Candidatus Eisenbacteria bacterium]
MTSPDDRILSAAAHAAAPPSAAASWIEIDTGAYRHNLAEFRRLIRPETRLMAVVKGNAYGHGLRLLAPVAAQWGADALGVNDLAEAAVLLAMELGRPIHLLGPALPQQLAEAADQPLEFTVASLEGLEALARGARRTGSRPRCHVKVETGCHRQGFTADLLPQVIDLFRRNPQLEWAGLSTHFANIEDTTDHTYARAQLESFHEIQARLARDGFKPPMLHTACSAATIVMPETHLDLVRVGISSYGIWPSRETLVSARMHGAAGPDLRPVMTWKSRVAQLKPVGSRAYIGYGCTHRTTRATRMAIVPVGYADGYDRRLSGVGHVLVRGRRAPILGRVCMNMVMADMTDVDGVAVGDEVVLLGRQGDEEITAYDLARLCQTIAYEITTRVAAHVPRVAGPPASA